MYVIKRLKQSQVLTYLTYDGPVHFSVLRLKRTINIQFISKLISFHLEKMYFSTCYILQGVTLINIQYLTSYTRYENNV